MIHNAEQEGGRVRRKREKRLARILASAMQIVRADGIEALTVQRLAEKLDYAPAALYRYFPSKDALLAELQREVVVEYEERFRRELESADAFVASLEAPPSGAPAGEGTPPRAQVEALFRILAAADFYRRYAASVPAEFRLLSMALRGDPRGEGGGRTREAVASLVEPLIPLAGILAGLFGAAEISGALLPGNVLERVLVLWAALHGLAQLRSFSGAAQGLFDEARAMSELERALLKGFGASDRALLLARDWLSRFRGGGS